jgi:hypothetical protein
LDPDPRGVDKPMRLVCAHAGSLQASGAASRARATMKSYSSSDTG